MKKRYVYICEICGRQSENKEDIQNCELFHSKMDEYWKKVLESGAYNALKLKAMIDGGFDSAVSYYVKKGIRSEMEEYIKEIDAVMETGW